MKIKRKYERVCFGGTFDPPIHIGHESLIRKAFDIGEFSYIGLTTDEYVKRRKPDEDVKPFDERLENLVRFLLDIDIPSERYKILALENFYHEKILTPENGVEAIVVSEKSIDMVESLLR